MKERARVAGGYQAFGGGQLRLASSRPYRPASYSASANTIGPMIGTRYSQKAAEIKILEGRETGVGPSCFVI
ncbi:MAG: hypothetical protein NUV85_02310 [Candidatus Berkelbacteria bacterium]|nr:hypothetical protein [Candidatus Berkelbacteria bacterium]